jgi:hypothetical protein
MSRTSPPSHGPDSPSDRDRLWGHRCHHSTVSIFNSFSFGLCRTTLHEVVLSIPLQRRMLPLVICRFVFGVFRLVDVVTHEGISDDRWCRMAPGQSTARQHCDLEMSFHTPCWEPQMPQGHLREDGLRLHSFSFHVPLSQIIVDEEAHLTFLFLDWVTRMV